MVGLEILVRIHPEKRMEFIQAFDLMTKRDGPNGSRIELAIFEQLQEQNTFLWIEHWETFESLTHYYQENKFKSLMGAIEILGQLIYKRSFSIEEEKQHA
jgi:quinol monooxygenase YgiN